MRTLSTWLVAAMGFGMSVACSAGGGSSFGTASHDATSAPGSSSGTFGKPGDPGSGNATTTGACTPAPGNYDIPGNNCDDDGDGVVDNPPTCDADVTSAGTAEDFARAIGICAKASDKGYGLVSAKFTRGFGRTDAPTPNQHGMLPRFGNVIRPREGKMLGVLSTGYAQEFDGPGNASFGIHTTGGFGGEDGVDWGGNGTLPPGFPKAAVGCRQGTDLHDLIDVVLELKAPQNSSGLAFDFNFFSSEWPAYICTEFNDGFIAYLTAKGFNGGTPDNISFDKNKNPVSVNNGFFDRCTPNVQVGCAGSRSATSQCPGGTDELAGTGFGLVGPWCSDFDGSRTNSVNGGATGWLSSQASVAAGETFTLELMLWDTGDGNLDSSILVDNFRWLEGQVTTTTTRPTGPQ